MKVMIVMMTHEHAEDIRNNKVLRYMNEQYQVAKTQGRAKEFLDENPEFVQMVMHEASKLIIEEDEDGMDKV